MARHYRRMVAHGDHLEPDDSGTGWKVMWDIRSGPETRWSAADAGTEAAALERAAHFVKLGFIVHAIMDPAGLVVLDAGQIADRFGAAPSSRKSRTPEESARYILQAFVGEMDSAPGDIVKLSVLSALFSANGWQSSDYEPGVKYAEAQGWVSATTETLVLTSAGHAEATD